MNLNPDEMRLAEEAAKWTDRRRAAPTDPSPELVAWLKLNPRHIDEYLLSQAIVDVLGQVSLSHIDVDKLAAEAAASVPLEEPDVRRRMAGDSAPERAGTPRARSRSRLYRSLSIAAALILSAFCLVWWQFSGNRTYSTGLGEQRTIRLADGSLLELNAQSAVAVRFTKATRNVQLLKGEALFIVAHNTARPFRVFAGRAVVQAVGTQFDVYRREGAALATRVAVVEGRVQIFEQGAPAMPPAGALPSGGPVQPSQAAHLAARTFLSAGEEAQVTGDGQVIKSEKPDVTNAVAWRQRRIVFNSATLAEVVKEFARYSDFHIQIEGAALAQRRIRGSFHADEPQALLALFENDNSVEIIHIENGVIIKAR